MKLINKNKIKLIIFLLLFLSTLFAKASSTSRIENNGKNIFRMYCWGCHHQTSMAFGPSFNEIAKKRTKEEIQGYIISPKSMFKQQGYKRSVMPAFSEKLSVNELNMISEYILFYKERI